MVDSTQTTGTVTDDDAVGTKTWADPTNAEADDGNLAIVQINTLA